MAASDGIAQYWRAMQAHPELIVFDNLTAQKIWQAYHINSGNVRFLGNLNYIAFIQSFMMAGVKGTALISYIGDLYKTASSPTATGYSIAKKAIKSAAVGWHDYNKQMNDLKNAELSDAWVKAARYSCRPVLDMMVHGLEIAPGDLAGG